MVKTFNCSFSLVVLCLLCTFTKNKRVSRYIRPSNLIAGKLDILGGGGREPRGASCWLPCQQCQADRKVSDLCICAFGRRDNHRLILWCVHLCISSVDHKGPLCFQVLTYRSLLLNLQVFVKAGDQVKAGDSLMVMIAMKMEVRAKRVRLPR